ncbi:uncharacterized protein G2W53_015249 [Senna tora]|uniref:Uncharacterized protein n=1 Tax=Senna tora TaxID=362788 RepID=A0A835C431_9FABA|nr:uncharacterized protein G2W53_015249 [Senna tora]
MSLGVAMKLSGIFAASVAAAASTTSASVFSSMQISHQDGSG